MVNAVEAVCVSESEKSSKTIRPSCRLRWIGRAGSKA